MKKGLDLNKALNSMYDSLKREVFNTITPFDERLNYYVNSSGTRLKWKYKDEERPEAQCYDCGKPYDACGDCSISDVSWEKINPTYHNGAGLLCANCMVERFRVVGVRQIPAILYIG